MSGVVGYSLNKSGIIIIFFYRQRQHTVRAKPGCKKERKDLEREKANHNADHPKNSGIIMHI